MYIYRKQAQKKRTRVMPGWEARDCLVQLLHMKIMMNDIYVCTYITEQVRKHNALKARQINILHFVFFEWGQSSVFH